MNNQLCIEIERATGRVMHTPKDFDFLRECIYARLNVLVSATTLKRIWGYLRDDVQTRQSTWDILARYLGYRDYEHYKVSLSNGEEQQSDPILSRRLNVTDELKCGDRLCVTWLPNRRCEITYQGNLRFEVLHSLNTRLQPGDTFQCGLFIEGEPLYLDNLLQEEKPPIAYVCGKKSGIRFEVLTHKATIV